jgi:D-alanyl-D-alanine carboxypeptidase
MQDGAAAAVTGGSVARPTVVVTGGSVVAGTVRVVDVAGATVVVVVEVEGAMLAGVDPVVVADTVGRAGLPQEVAEKATTIVSAPTIASRAPALVSVNPVMQEGHPRNSPVRPRPRYRLGTLPLVALDRADVRPGMAVPGGELVEAFASAGWYWGGRWTGSPDYQHFSLTGG